MWRNILVICILFLSFSTVSKSSEAPEKGPQPGLEHANSADVFSSPLNALKAAGSLILSVLLASLAWRAYKEIIDPSYTRLLQNIINRATCCHRRQQPTAAAIATEMI